MALLIICCRQRQTCQGQLWTARGKLPSTEEKRESLIQDWPGHYVSSQRISLGKVAKSMVEALPECVGVGGGGRSGARGGAGVFAGTAKRSAGA